MELQHDFVIIPGCITWRKIEYYTEVTTQQAWEVNHKALKKKKERNVPMYFWVEVVFH